LHALENRTLSSSHVDASHVTQIKIGVWPGTGFESQMISTFSVEIFRLGILDYLSRRTVYFGKFPFGQIKTVLPFTSQPKFPDFSVNGKQPCFPVHASCQLLSKDFEGGFGSSEVRSELIDCIGGHYNLTKTNNSLQISLHESCSG